MLSDTYELIACGQRAWETAQELANRNGCPVAIVDRDGWYRIEEDAEAFEALVEAGWGEHAVVQPSC